MATPPPAPSSSHRVDVPDLRVRPADRWADRWLAVRRAVLLRRRLLAACCAGLAVLVGIGAVAPAPPPTEVVTVARHDLAAGTTLAPDDVEERAVAPDFVPAGAVTPADLVGRTTTGAVRAGEILTDARTLSADLLRGQPGQVATPVRIPDAGSVDLVRVGDRVDILAADPQGAAPASVVTAGALVVAIPQESTGFTGPGLGGRLVVLATTARTAQDLATAGVTRHLSLVISGR